MLDTLDKLVAAYEAARGGQGTAGALREHLDRMRDALERAGLDAATLRDLAEQARARAARNRPGAGASSSSQTGFDPHAAQSLRAQIGKLRKISESQIAGDSGSGGVNRGPGVAPLELNHRTQSADDLRFDSSTFATSPSQDTVLLGGSLSRRAEDAHADPLGTVDRRFEAGTDTEFWPKHVEPRHRAVLERYFGTSAHE